MDFNSLLETAKKMGETASKINKRIRKQEF